MLHAVNDMSINEAQGTETTMKATAHLLNCAATHPDAEVICRKSDVILHVDSDAAHLVAPEARSGAGGCHCLSDVKGTAFNGPVLIPAKVIKNVMASAAEAEIGALFVNAQEAAGMRACSEVVGWPQPATPMKTDNGTANGIINDTMKQRRSKALDVRFHWLKDQVKQGQFCSFWESGKNDLGDHHAKHQPAAVHKLMRPIQTCVKGKSPGSLQGCVGMMNGRQTASNLNLSSAPALMMRATCLPCSRCPQCGLNLISETLFTLVLMSGSAQKEGQLKCDAQGSDLSDVSTNPTMSDADVGACKSICKAAVCSLGNQMDKCEGAVPSLEDSHTFLLVLFTHCKGLDWMFDFLLNSQADFGERLCHFGTWSSKCMRPALHSNVRHAPGFGCAWHSIVGNSHDDNVEGNGSVIKGN